MERKDIFFTAPRFILGLGIICVGILFLLGNMDIIDAGDYFHYWPVLLIFIGIAHIFQCERGSSRIWGIILIFVGSAMLLRRLHFIDFNLWSYWPLLLVAVGVMMIYRASARHRSFATDTFGKSGVNSDINSFVKAFAVMGGFRRSNNSQDFKGGDLTAIMGGLEIDLRDASIKGDAVIDIFTLMGGVEIRIPDDWLVIIDGFPIMGGYEDKTRPPKQGSKHLIVKGTVIMGGVEIKN